MPQEHNSSLPRSAYSTSKALPRDHGRKGNRFHKWQASRTGRWFLVLFTAVALLLPHPGLAAAPSDASHSDAPDPVKQVGATHIRATDWPAIALQPMPGSYVNPVHISNAGDTSARLFVVEKSGLIRIVRNGQALPDAFLDISDRVNSDCGECGLLSVAFPPDFESGGYFFVYYTAIEDVADPEPEDNGRDSGNDTVIARFRLSADPDRADPASEERILVRNQPYVNHNGGLLAFGPDGYLYAGLGDGGGGGDPLGNGQRTSTLLGKLLRLQVTSTGAYSIPSSNPFINSPSHRPEIWALGLRNPWRFAFDRQLGDLFIADVGQSEFEEVNHQSAASAGGQNYGWNIMEGAVCYDAATCDQTGLTLPVHQYGHSEPPCSSVTGGTVYRGPRLAWRGVYFFADYCTGRIFGLRRSAGVWESAELLDTNISITSFGEDEAGELYLAGRAPDGTGESAGVVYRLAQSDIFFLPTLLNAQPE